MSFLKLSDLIYQFSQRTAEAVLDKLDFAFNRVFTSKYNPLYRSGTIAVTLLSIATITGIILVMFYRVGSPYDSVSHLNSNFILSWVRTLHRYASDATVVAVILHVIRMWTQKKSFGSRLMPWMIGVVLVLFIFIIGWTGFILVWDQQGQVLAMAIAKFLDLTGLFAEPISSAFDGRTIEPPTAFIFFNLFIHLALPLIFIFTLWAHTAKMARAKWFPHKNLLLGLTGVLFVIAFAWPAPLAKKADLLAAIDSYPLDLFFNFWLPWVSWSAPGTLLILVGIFGALVLAPLLLNPLKRRPPSDLDERKCQGCTQCALDCPYEAITMVPRKGEALNLSNSVASVNSDRCVSCGLCAASCGPMTIGPPERKGSDQYSTVRRFINDLKSKKEDLRNQVVVITCNNQVSTHDRIKHFSEQNGGCHVYPVACMGTLHMATIGHLGLYFKSVLLAACAERNCSNKDAYFLLRDRLTGVREPGLPGRVEAHRVQLLSIGSGEERRVYSEVNKTETKRSEDHTFESVTETHLHRIVAFLGGVLVAAGVAYAAAIDMTSSDSRGVVRIGARMQAPRVEVCREQTEEELSRLPRHMQIGTSCESKPLSFQLNLWINNEKHIGKEVSGERILHIHEDVKLDSGRYQVRFELKPTATDKELENVKYLPADSYSGALEVKENKIHLIFYDTFAHKWQVRSEDEK